MIRLSPACKNDPSGTMRARSSFAVRRAIVAMPFNDAELISVRLPLPVASDMTAASQRKRLRQPLVSVAAAPGAGILLDRSCSQPLGIWILLALAAACAWGFAAWRERRGQGGARWAPVSSFCGWSASARPATTSSGPSCRRTICVFTRGTSRGSFGSRGRSTINPRSSRPRSRPRMRRGPITTRARRSSLAAVS